MRLAEAESLGRHLNLSLPRPHPVSDSKLYTDRLLSYWDRSLFGFKHASYTHGASEAQPTLRR